MINSKKKKKKISDLNVQKKKKLAFTYYQKRYL